MRQTQGHRGRIVPALLGARLHVVAPHQPDGRPVQRALTPLGEGDRLPLVVGPAVAEQQVGQVDREQRVAGAPGCPRRRRPVLDPAVAESAEGLGVGRVFVRVDGGHAPGGDDAGDEFFHRAARGLGVGSPVTALELGALAPLRRRHRAAAAQLGVVEAVDEVRGADQEVQVEGPVLPALEAAKAIEDQRLARRPARAQRLVQQQAVAPEALRLALEGGVRDAELPRDLAQPRAAEQAGEERAQQLRALEPVGGGEGL